MKRQEFMAWLHEHGCVLVREGARHSWYGNPSENKRSSIPRHKEINDLLVIKICKDLGIPRP